MAHTHDENDSTFYLEQLSNIGICAALGCVGVLLWYQNKLKWMLNDKFHLPVLAAGITLLVLVVLRAASIWISARTKNSQIDSHDHEHSHDHNHDHAHDHVHTHDHTHGEAHSQDHGHTHAADDHHDHGHAHAEGQDDHGHDHAWSPWRYSLLLLPVILYLLNMPNQGFSSIKALDASDLGEEKSGVQKKEGDAISLEFKELDRAANNQESREYYEGKTGRLRGQLATGNNDKVFSLVRFKMTCCAADAIPLNVVILTPKSLQDAQSQIRPFDWVEVEGQIQFRNRKDRNEFVPVLKVQSMEKIRKIPAEANAYIQ